MTKRLLLAALLGLSTGALLHTTPRQRADAAEHALGWVCIMTYNDSGGYNAPELQQNGAGVRPTQAEDAEDSSHARTAVTPLPAHARPSTPARNASGAKKAMKEIIASSITESDKARFWGHVSKDGECWEWKSSRDPDGYGYFFMRRPLRAHRVAYALAFGETPVGLMVCHHCDNPPCVNPAHLFIGKHLDNMADKRRKGRGGGEQHGMAKLTGSMVIEIRELVSLGHGCQELGRRFGVCETSIYNIIRGKTWLHV